MVITDPLKIIARQKRFIEKSREVHGDRYDYDEAIYQHCDRLVLIKCKIHGGFFMIPSSHMKGHGCKDCYRDSKRITYTEFILRAREIHNNRFEYNDSWNWNGISSKTIITCPLHGAFEICGTAHITQKQGCPTCGGTKKLTQTEFISRAIAKHGNRYDYSKSVYSSAHKPLTVICKDHGAFQQEAWTHIFDGSGCPDCAMRQVSVISKACNMWLDSLDNNISIQREKWLTNIKRNVDGFDSTSNTVYQFHGDYWHGNPNVYDPHLVHPVIGLAYGELYERTLDRDRAVRDAGYDLVVMWEFDFFGKKNHGYKRRAA